MAEQANDDHDDHYMRVADNSASRLEFQSFCAPNILRFDAERVRRKEPAAGEDDAGLKYLKRLLEQQPKPTPHIWDKDPLFDDEDETNLSPLRTNKENNKFTLEERNKQIEAN